MKHSHLRILLKLRELFTAGMAAQSISSLFVLFAQDLSVGSRATMYGSQKSHYPWLKCHENEEKIDNDYVLRNDHRIKTTQPFSIILIFFPEDNVLSDKKKKKKSSNIKVRKVECSVFWGNTRYRYTLPKLMALDIISFSHRVKSEWMHEQAWNSGGSRGGATGFPPPKIWSTVCVFSIPFCIRMLQNMAQIARESMKKTYSFQGPWAAPDPRQKGLGFRDRNVRVRT